MKLIWENKLYIQKRDYNMLFNDVMDASYYIDSSNDLEFVEVKDEEYLSIVNKRKDILDISEYILLSDNELNNMLKAIESKLILESRLSVMEADSKLVRMHEKCCISLINEAVSLANLILYKEGFLSLDIPGINSKKRKVKK